MGEATQVCLESIMPDAPNFLSMLTGCFATPVAENPTVAMVEAAYRHHGIDARYINCDVSPERLGEAVRGALAMGWVGFNCSIPHNSLKKVLACRAVPHMPRRNCESFNSKLRDESLNGEIFYSLAEAKVIIEAWRRYYNTARPHSLLGYRPPAPQAVVWPAPTRGSAPTSAGDGRKVDMH